jgi:hypothetical protein
MKGKGKPEIIRKTKNSCVTMRRPCDKCQKWRKENNEVTEQAE